MNDNLKLEIKAHCDLYNKAEKVFKKTQLVDLELETGVLNEFRYCARAQVDLFELIIKSDGEVLDQEITSALQVSNRALLCAVNDSIDTIVNYSKIAADSLEDKFCDGDDIATVYGFEKYLAFWESIKYIEDKIAESRERRDLRLDVYYDLVDSDQLKVVTDFCSALNIIESKLRKSHNAAKKNSRQWITSQGIQFMIAGGTVTAAIIGILVYLKP